MGVANEVVIVAGCRTAIGKFQGSLSDVSAPQLGAAAVREAVKRANLYAGLSTTGVGTQKSFYDRARFDSEWGGRSKA